MVAAVLSGPASDDSTIDLGVGSQRVVSVSALLETARAARGEAS
jgi:hypothetical protein